MGQFSFVFTIFFMLLGPVKLIPSFAGLTRGAEGRFKRSVAIRGVVIASVLCAFVALAGGTLLSKYHISIDALRISGGLVLLIAALHVIFPRASASSPGTGTPTALQLAASPVALPMIVPPAGVAAILIFMMLAPQYPGMLQAVTICLATMMVLDFLVMYFIDQVMKTPGLMIVLTVLGSVLVFVQAALAMQMFLVALKSLGVIKV
ncbi:MAG: MarC family protein [Acidobacteriia bacterium]|nr:MarC family protein [Terriglobia bacterium]